MKQAGIITAFALLGVVAVAGWTRNPSPAQSAGPNYFQAPNGFSSQPVTADASRTVYGQQPYNTGAQPYAAMPVGSSAYAPAGWNNCAEPMYAQNVAYAPAYTERYRTYSRPRVVRTYVRDEAPVREVVVRRKGRTWKKSAAIVGGSAGVGAAVGALAGGGRGAAIGALAGGGAGFLYDRLTHNR